MSARFEVVECSEVRHTLGQHPGVARLANGDLLLTYDDYTDAMEGSTGYVTRSSNNGRTWSEPQLVIASRFWHGGIHLTLGMQTLKSGRVLIPWCDGGNHKRYPRWPYQFLCLRSDDEGHTWKGWDPQDIGVHSFFPYGKIVELDNGTLICPGGGYVGKDDEEGAAGTVRSRDGGETWGDYTRIAARYGETDLTLLFDGRILALLRQGHRELPWTDYSFSEDGGLTWTEPKPTNVLGQNFNAWLTPSGTLVGACRGIDGTGKRRASEIEENARRYTPQRGYGIHFFLAEDDGSRWEYQFTLPDPKGWTYTAYHESGEPCFCNLPNGDIFIGYYSYDESIFETLNLEGMPAFTKGEAARIPQTFKRRPCDCILRETCG